MSSSDPTRSTRYLATGDSYTTIASSNRVGISTVAGIVPEVSRAIWDSLVDDFLPVPKTADSPTVWVQWMGSMW